MAPDARGRPFFVLPVRAVTTESIPVLIGGGLILLVVLGLVSLLLRDFVRIVLKIIALAVILGGVAMWLGWLDSSLVGDLLSGVGEWVVSVYNAVADRFAGAPGTP